jgi:hypothetical protein
VKWVLAGHGGLDVLAMVSSCRLCRPDLTLGWPVNVSY